MGRKPKDTKYLFLRGGRWWIKFNRGDTHIIKTTGCVEADIKGAIEKRDEELRPHLLEDEVEKKAAAVKNLMTVEERLAEAKDALPAMTLREAWEAFRIAPKGKTSRGRIIMPGERTLMDYEAHWRTFCDWMEKHYPKKDDKRPIELRSVTPDQVQRYIAEISATRSSNTRNKVLTLLRLVFKVLAEKARVKKNPFDGLDAAPLAMTRKRPLTGEELQTVSKLLEGKGEMEILFSLGYYTGARLGDCVSMRWDMIDMGARKIRYTPHKTRKSNEVITITVHPTLFSLLDQVPKSDRHGLVLPELGTFYTTRTGVAAVSKRVQKVFEDAGIDTGLKVEGYSRAVAQVGFHSLRHAHITALLENGIPMDAVRQQAGHASLEMTARYYHASEKTLQATAAALPIIGGTSGADASGAKLEAVLAGLAGLGKEELAKVAVRVKEMMGK
jgi:integrase